MSLAIEIDFLEIFLIFLFFVPVGLSNDLLHLRPEVVNLLQRPIMAIRDRSLLRICRIMLRMVRL